MNSKMNWKMRLAAAICISPVFISGCAIRAELGIPLPATRTCGAEIDHQTLEIRDVCETQVTIQN